jgi:hypothetical protein
MPGVHERREKEGREMEIYPIITKMNRMAT